MNHSYEPFPKMFHEQAFIKRKTKLYVKDLRVKEYNTDI